MIFNQIISWRFDLSMPHQANNKFWGHEVIVKGSSIGILTDRSLVKMLSFVYTSYVICTKVRKAVYVISIL